MIDKTPRTEHFKRNLLTWIALHHFLPASLLRELSYILVDVVSEGESALTDLFEETLFGVGALESWAIRPLVTKTTIESYLQHLIRSFVWQNDSDAPSRPHDDKAQKLKLEQLEQAVLLGKLDLFNVKNALTDNKEITEPGVIALSKMLRQFSERLEFVQKFEQNVEPPLIVAQLEAPLRPVLKKHLGDLCADADRWHDALSLYEDAQSDFATISEQEWMDFAHLMDEMSLQSRASALRTIRGSSEAAVALKETIGQSSLRRTPLIVLNASHDALAAEILGMRGLEVWRDRRASILLTPTLLGSHDTNVAIEYWLAGKFRDANRQFWAVLRRQFALGSAQQSRTTKEQYARSLFDEVMKTSDRNERPDAFWMGLKLLTESGKAEAAKQLPWDEEIVRTYLTEDVVNRIISHAERYAGAKLERTAVIIECFSRWIPLLSREQSDVANLMLTYLARLPLERALASPWTSQDVGGRSIELLSEVADKRPEFSREITGSVVRVVSEKLKNEVGWKTRADSIKLALAFLRYFNFEELVQAVDSVLSALDVIDPQRDQWPLVQPAMDLLMSEEVPRISVADPERGSRIAAAVLRFGLNQRSEHARLLYYLEDFGSGSLRVDSISENINAVVAQVSAQARTVNASNATYAINALLYSPKVAGTEGFTTGLDALKEVLRSVDNSLRSISFSHAYTSIRLLAERQDLILAEARISREYLLSELNEVLDLLVRVWEVGRINPLIFTTFSIPSATKPNAVLVHNWAFSSIALAQSLNREAEILAAIRVAEAEPALKDAIALARATRLAGGASEQLSVEKIEQDTAAAFYAALGQRLLYLLSFEDDLRRVLTDAMLKKVLKEGPRGLDAAVFLAAAQSGIRPSVDNLDYQHYRMRLNNQSRNLRLALFPMLDRLLAVTNNS